MKIKLITLLTLLILMLNINVSFACSYNYAKQFEGKIVTIYLDENVGFKTIQCKILKVTEDYVHFRDLKTNATLYMWLEYITEIKLQ